MRRFCLILTLLVALLLASRESRAVTVESQIHLLIMGPGEHLYTRGGHAALMVVELEDGTPVRSAVYNYGDTHWDDPLLVPRFLRGNLVFFLSRTGSMIPTLQEYGVRQGRAVTHQRLRLTPGQVAEVKRRLEEGIVPGKREYTFHHVHALCSTQIVDLLDDVLEGQIRKELAGSPGPSTARHYQELVFSASNLASIAGDLFLGRLHDRVLDRYESTASPEYMRDSLQTILVAGPSGTGERVPLADAPIPLVDRVEPLVVRRNGFTRLVWSALTVWLLIAAARAYRGLPAAPVPALKVLLWSALVSGTVGLFILAFLLFSRVPEFRWNELILLFWPTDLWLALRVRRLLREPARPDRWILALANARLAVAALVVLAHLTGLFYQEPRVLVVLGCALAVVTWALVQRLHRRPALSGGAAPLPAT